MVSQTTRYENRVKKYKKTIELPEPSRPYKKESEWLKKSGKERFEEIKDLLDYFVAGEDRKKLLLYILLAGCWKKDLISLILNRGDSSAGKSHLVKSVLELFPEDEVYILDSATAAALYYDEERLNRSKILFLREMKPQMELVESLKSLYDEDSVRKEVVRIKGDGNYESRQGVLDRVTKQLGVITTFSFENVQVDLVNRAWVLTPDQTFSQTRKIIDFSVEKEANLILNEIQKHKIKNKCNFIGRTLKVLNWEAMVYIPYVNLLKPLFPESFLNVRRDFSKLIKLIKIITLLNQYNRMDVVIEGQRYFFAEYYDLYLALWVSEDIFINQILHIDKTKREILDFIQFNKQNPVSMEVENVKYTITEVYEHIRDIEGVSRKTVQRKLNDLFYEGYLLREKQGGAYVFSKLRDYNIIENLELEKLKESIDFRVQSEYQNWKDGVYSEFY